MMSPSNILTTNGITVSVRTAFVPEQSSLDQNNFVFAYEIEIENQNNFPIQLISRKWVITDALLGKRHVSGLGVVGDQPIILPENKYSYISGCHFKTPIGKMQGYYKMINLETSEVLIARIPEFTMYCPYFMN